MAASPLDQPVNWGPADLIDLDRYPILDLDSAAGSKLVAEVQARMKAEVEGLQRQAAASIAQAVESYFAKRTARARN